MALVIKSWYADAKPNSEGSYVSIAGRQQGLLSWLLSVLGIDPVTRVRIDGQSVYFEKGSLAGFEQRVIPLSSLCSAYYGYTKPWQVALVLGAMLLPIMGLGLIVGPLYYFLNKKLSMGMVEVSGLVSGIEFKRSVIEGQNIDEKEGMRVIGVIHGLIMREAASRSSSSRAA